jgi:predicted PurR-regulated permease PerM
MNERERQRAADSVGVVLAWAGLAALAYLVYLVVRPFLIPLGWAGVLAIVFYPLHAALARRWGPGWAAGATTLAATLVLIVPLLVVLTAFVREAIQAVGDLQRSFEEGRLAWIERGWTELEARVPIVERFDLAAAATGAAERGVAFLVSQTGFVLRDVATFVLNLVLSLFATFFLLRDSAAIVHAIRRLLPMSERMREDLLARTRELISVGVTSAGIVAAVQGLLGGLVFAALGIAAPVFWGVVMAFLCVLPFGAWVVWLPAAVVLAAGGEVVRALVLAALGFGIVSAADNVLRPMLLSGRAHMNGLVIFLSLLGGLAVFGLIGLVFGPVLIATALALVTAYIDAGAERPDATV